MAGRKLKEGLDYFELDCHMDEKVRLIQAEYGLKGFAIVVKLFQKIYGELGYYCEWKEDNLLLFASEMGSDCGRDLINGIVSACIRRNIFSEDLYLKYRILTSSGIQKRYMRAAIERKEINLIKEYLLINPDENLKNLTINSIYRPINSNNRSINEQRREEKKREEKRRANSSAPEERHPTAEDLMRERGFSDDLITVVLEWQIYKTEKHQPYYPTGFHNLLVQISEKVKIHGEIKVIALIRKCMGSNWDGIIWERLDKQTRKENRVPPGGYDWENL